MVGLSVCVLDGRPAAFEKKVLGYQDVRGRNMPFKKAMRLESRPVQIQREALTHYMAEGFYPMAARLGTPSEFRGIGQDHEKPRDF